MYVKFCELMLYAFFFILLVVIKKNFFFNKRFDITSNFTIYNKKTGSAIIDSSILILTTDIIRARVNYFYQNFE